MYLQSCIMFSSCCFVIIFLINKCLNTGFKSKQQSKELTIIYNLFSSISSLNKSVSYTNYIDVQLQTKLLYFAENPYEWEKIPDNRISNLIHSYTQFKKTCPKGRYLIPNSGYCQISHNLCEDYIYLIQDGIKNKNIRDYTIRKLDSLKNSIITREDFICN